MKHEQIKPCPFCGNKNPSVEDSSLLLNRKGFTVICMAEGGCCASSAECSTEAEAVESWNLRTHSGREAERSIFDEVIAERKRAHEKHGDTSIESFPAHDPYGDRLSILIEEVGEVAKEFNEARHEGRAVDLAKLRKELIQTCAMAGAWADACTVATIPPNGEGRG